MRDMIRMLVIGAFYSGLFIAVALLLQEVNQ